MGIVVICSNKTLWVTMHDRHHIQRVLRQEKKEKEQEPAHMNIRTQWGMGKESNEQKS
jgi:hypothetical protein